MVFVVLVLIIIIIINFFGRVFSECTEVIATSLVPSDTILHEICAFIIGFSCTVWTKMAGSLADGMLADTILIPPRPPIPLTNIRREGVVEKSTESSNRKNIY